MSGPLSNITGYIALQGAAILAADFVKTLVSPRRRLGPIITQVTVSELHDDRLRITDHPVEQGAVITDHAFKLPATVRVVAGWTPGGALVPRIGQPSVFGNLPGLLNVSYLNDVYARLLRVQSDRVPLTVVTARRTYYNMLIEAISTQVDEKTDNILLITALCREILIVQTQVVTVPPNDVQADPQTTGAVQDQGNKQLAPAENINTDYLPSFNGGTA